MVGNQSCDWPLSTSIIEANILAITKFSGEHGHFIVDKLVSLVGLKYESVHSIISEDFWFLENWSAKVIRKMPVRTFTLCR